MKGDNILQRNLGWRRKRNLTLMSKQSVSGRYLKQLPAPKVKEIIKQTMGIALFSLLLDNLCPAAPSMNLLWKEAIKIGIISFQVYYHLLISMPYMCYYKPNSNWRPCWSLRETKKRIILFSKAVTSYKIMLSNLIFATSMQYHYLHQHLKTFVTWKNLQRLFV